MKTRPVMVEGVKCELMCNICKAEEMGMHISIVSVDGEERLVVKVGTKYRFWTGADRAEMIKKAPNV